MAESKSGFPSSTEQIFCLCPDSILSPTWGIQVPRQDGNKFYREQCSHHRESSSTGDKVIACMSQEDYSSAWNEPIVAGKVRRITQKQVQESGKMGFKHWEKLYLHIYKLFGDCFPLKVLWKQPATTGSCPVVLRGGDYI